MHTFHSLRHTNQLLFLTFYDTPAGMDKDIKCECPIHLHLDWQTSRGIGYNYLDYVIVNKGFQMVINCIYSAPKSMICQIIRIRLYNWMMEGNH